MLNCSGNNIITTQLESKQQERCFFSAIYLLKNMKIFAQYGFNREFEGFKKSALPWGGYRI